MKGWQLVAGLACWLFVGVAIGALVCPVLGALRRRRDREGR